MGLYADHIVPWICAWSMRQKVLRPYRARVAAAAEGRVLEIGAGSGLNLPLYERAARSVIALEPSPRLLRMARETALSARIPVELLEASGERLPFDDASMDTIVATWTLCTIPDALRALGEMRRVLRPGGALLFVEHGRAPEPEVARWQDRLDPLWSRISGGCHLNRPIARLIEEAGFHIKRLETTRIPGPRTHTFFYEGRAVPR